MTARNRDSVRPGPAEGDAPYRTVEPLHLDPEAHVALRSTLVLAIEATSEDEWCAGWMAGIEHDLWERDGGHAILGRLLGEWPTRRKERDHKLVWVSLTEWQPLHDAWRAARAARAALTGAPDADA